MSFLSTPSARRATCTSPIKARDTPNFYPRPPRGGRREQIPAGSTCEFISIHALREEGDIATQMDMLGNVEISIHALREEGDALNKISGQWDNISIHALREEGD